MSMKKEDPETETADMFVVCDLWQKQEEKQ